MKNFFKDDDYDLISLDLSFMEPYYLYFGEIKYISVFCKKYNTLYFIGSDDWKRFNFSSLNLFNTNKLFTLQDMQSIIKVRFVERLQEAPHLKKYFLKNGLGQYENFLINNCITKNSAIFKSFPCFKFDLCFFDKYYINEVSSLYNADYEVQIGVFKW